MSVIRIASRYAKSLLDLAKDQNVLPSVVEDITGLQKMVQNRDLYLLLKSPIITADKKGKIFDALFEGKVNKLTKAFFDIIIKKGREGYLPEIADEFINQYRNFKGISSVKVTTAAPLTDAALESIKAKLLESDATQQAIEIETEVDESLIGGFVIQIEDKLLDASVAHKLRELSKNMIDNKFEKAL